MLRSRLRKLKALPISIDVVPATKQKQFYVAQNGAEWLSPKLMDLAEGSRRGGRVGEYGREETRS